MYSASKAFAKSGNAVIPAIIIPSIRYMVFHPLFVPIIAAPCLSFDDSSSDRGAEVLRDLVVKHVLRVDYAF